ncbi:MAG: hypothetical protein ACYC7D_13295 [Nitrososphaerales archaeon]
MRKIAIVGSKSLAGHDQVYAMIVKIVSSELANGPFIVVNGGEEGLDQMAGEIALCNDLDYEIVPLERCTLGCEKEYCFEHSYKQRSSKLAEEAEKIYRIYDDSCGTSTCGVTAKFGDELGKIVSRLPVDLLFVGQFKE